jgi:hypothetical protein
MSKPHKISLRSIVAASVASPAVLEAQTPPQPPQEAQRKAQAAKTLKQRAKQMSVYLEPEVYDQLRDIAYTERTKIHPLMLEALDMLFKQRGARSIRQLAAETQR